MRERCDNIGLQLDGNVRYHESPSLSTEEEDRSIKAGRPGMTYGDWGMLGVKKM